jgi:hypothetical protein
MLTQFFGGKAWFKSMTAWGLIVWATAEAVMGQICEAGILSPDACSSAGAIVSAAGAILAALGIRRAATAPNSPPS